MMLGACPKRQTTSRIVYVPSPPSPQATSTATLSDSIVITDPTPQEEPVTAAPQEETATTSATTQAHGRRRRPVRTEPPEAAAAIETPETPEPPAADIAPPPLETRDDPAVRSEVLSLQADLQKRIEDMGRQELPKVDQKTFEDAKLFLEQSGRALDQSDLQRALMLAKKASLLLASLQR